MHGGYLGLVTLLLALYPIQGSPNGTTTLLISDRDDLPGLREEHLLLLLAPLVVTVTLAVTAVVYVFSGSQRSIRMPSLLMLVMWTALVTVGLVAWGITYASTKIVIEEKQEQVLIVSVERTMQNVHQEMDTGIRILQLVGEFAASGDLNLDATWPEPQVYIKKMLRTIGLATDSVHLLYVASPAGRMHGVRPHRSFDYHYFCVLQDDDLPWWVSCPPKNFIPRNDPTFCDRVQNDDQCGNDTRTEKRCAATCLGVENAGLAQNNPVEQQLCYGTPQLHRLIVTAVESSSLEFEPSTQGGFNYLPYTPQARPWFTNGTDLMWSDPYLFASGSGTGITASQGVFSSRGEFLGVVAVDFSLWSLNTIMQKLRPTTNSLSAIVTLKGYLVGASLPEDALQEDIGMEDLRTMLLQVGNFPNKESRISQMFASVAARYGSIHAAADQTSLFMDGGQIIMSFPTEVCGSVLIMSLTLPYSDTMGDASDASVSALALAVCMSVLCAFLVFVGVSIILSPLSILAADMSDVALMKIGGKTLSGQVSRIAEVGSMQDSFHKMVMNLAEFKNYLPQSVLCDAKDTTLSPASNSHSILSERTFQTNFPDLTNTNPNLSDSSSASSAVRRETNSVFSPGLKPKSASLLVVNVKGFHTMVKQLNQNQLVSLHEKYLDPVVTTVRNFRGIVDELSGDHIFLSFNTVLHTPGHCAKAVECSLRVKSVFKDQIFTELAFLNDVPSLHEPQSGAPLPVTLALTTGRALCGNLGSSGVKKFVVIGHASSTVRLYERCGATWGVSILTDHTMETDEAVRQTTELRTLLRIFNHKNDPIFLYEIVDTKRNTRGNEWMYSLATLEETTKLAAHNTLVQSIYDGNWGVAREKLTHLKNTSAEYDPVSKSLVTMQRIAELDTWLQHCTARNEIPPTIWLNFTASMYPGLEHKGRTAVIQSITQVRSISGEDADEE